MFGTLSFPNNGGSRNLPAGSFAQGDPGHSTRKFACESCRAHKVKCSGDQLGCARCVGLKLKCVYDRTSKYSSRSSRPQKCRSISPTAGMELSWSIYSPKKGSSHKHHSSERSRVSEKDSDAVFQEAYSVDRTHTELSPPSISPELLSSVPTSEGRSCRTPHSSPYIGDGTDLDFISSALDYSDHLDWTFEDDTKPKNAPTDLITYGLSESTHLDQYKSTDATASTSLAPRPSSPGNDNRTSPSPAPCSGTIQQDASLARSSQAFEALTSRPSSPLNPCACSSRLSELLFNLSGYSRWYPHSSSLTPPRGSGIPLGQNMSFVFAAHERAARLGDDVLSCAPQCFAQGPNTAQLVMLIEQIVDLYTGLVEQLPAVSCAGDEQTVIPVRVGEYMVESVAERRSLIALLVREKLMAITGLSVRFRERLRGVSGQAGQCRERLHASIQRLELLRDV